jgi:hypothetical protein
LIKRIFEKVQKKIIIYAYNADSENAILINKLSGLSKSYRNLSLIYSINSGFHKQRLDDFGELDLKVPIGLYETNELYKILSDRCKMAFQHDVPEENKEYLFDIVSELHVRVPGSYINCLKQIYFLRSDKGIEARDILQASYSNCADSQVSYQEITQSIQECSILDRLFLEHIIAEMKSKKCLYLKNPSLIDSYRMGLEELDIKFREDEYLGSLRRLNEIGILVPSLIHRKNKQNATVSTVPHYIPFPLSEIENLLRMF